jgi:hypothetical protein
MEFDDLILQFKKNNYDPPAITEFEHIKYKDILRVFSTFYLITMIWFLIFLTITFLTQYHFPYVVLSAMEKYSEFNKD